MFIIRPWIYKLQYCLGIGYIIIVMGDKKRNRDNREKKKDKKRDKDDKKKKKDKYSSDSNDSESDSRSDSSKSNQKRKKDKHKKVKKDKKEKKFSPPKQTVPAVNNVPYNFDAIPTANTNYSGATIPGLKGINIAPLPPPVPNVPTTSSVPKPKSKQPNIFKLLPKLHGGCVLFAKTIYSSDYISDNLLNRLLMQMARDVQQTTKDQQHKKGISQIAKCINQLQKAMVDQKQEQVKQQQLHIVPRQKNNRYQILQKVYHDHLQKINRS